jgi:hypothetical protein
MSSILMLIGLYFYVAAIVVVVMLTIPFFHESGHFVAARLAGFDDAKIGFKKSNLVPSRLQKFVSIPVNLPAHVTTYPDPKRVTFFFVKMLIVILSGIIAGFIPLYLPYYLLDPLSAAILAAFYLYSCRGDFGKIYLLFAGRIDEMLAD